MTAAPQTKNTISQNKFMKRTPAHSQSKVLCPAAKLEIQFIPAAPEKIPIVPGWLQPAAPIKRPAPVVTERQFAGLTKEQSKFEAAQRTSRATPPLQACGWTFKIRKDCAAVSRDEMNG
jgi:hypothetical protein